MKVFNDNLEVGDEFFHNGSMWLVIAPGQYAMIIGEEELEKYKEEITLQ